MDVGCSLQLRELPRPHRGGAEVADLDDLDEVVEGFHGLLDRGVRVEAVDLVEVDVVGAESGQGRVHLLHDRLAGQAAVPRAVSDLDEHLRREDDLLTLGELAERFTDDAFGVAE